MGKLKLALVWGNHYDDKIATTHHSYFEAALKDMGVEFHRFSWTDWQVQMKHEYDLYFFIDFNPCLYKLHDKSFHPRVFFWWDCLHFPFSYVAQVTEMFDRSYMAEKNVVDALNAQGLDSVHWLPPAFYEGIYRPLDVQKDLDFTFVGQPDDSVVRKGLTRKQLVEKVRNDFNGLIEQGVYGNDVNLLYNRSRILFDRTIYNNVGTRVFETIGSGGFALVNKGKVKSGLEKLAIDGHHYVSYDDSYDDLRTKMMYYIRNEEERKRIAKAGYAHFLANHTYRHRIETILKDFGLENR